MLSLAYYRSTVLCPMCRLPKAICQAPDAERKFKAEADRCHATRAIRRQQRDDTDAGVEFPDTLIYEVTHTD